LGVPSPVVEFFMLLSQEGAGAFSCSRILSCSGDLFLETLDPGCFVRLEVYFDSVGQGYFGFEAEVSLLWLLRLCKGGVRVFFLEVAGHVEVVPVGLPRQRGIGYFYIGGVSGGVPRRGTPPAFGSLPCSVQRL